IRRRAPSRLIATRHKPTLARLVPDRTEGPPMAIPTAPFPRRTSTVAATAVVAGVLWLRAFDGLPGETIGWWLIIGGIATLTAVVVLTVERRGRSAAVLGGWTRHSERHHGV